jgi:hypothetical protein
LCQQRLVNGQQQSEKGAALLRCETCGAKLTTGTNLLLVATLIVLKEAR